MDTVAFWHKYRRPGEKLRLVSTDFEANLVSKNIRRDRVIEIYFEHLDSYIEMDIRKTFNEKQNSKDASGYQHAICTNKEGRTEYSSSGDDFEDSDYMMF